MRSRGGAHALLGSTDWAVAVRPSVYACMCPATLAPLTPMHARLTLTCGSDYSDGVAPMPHACMHGLNHSDTLELAEPMHPSQHKYTDTTVCKRGIDHSDLDI